MQKNDSSLSLKLLCIALFQGLALLILHQVIEKQFWPFKDSQWLFSFYGFTLATPSLLLLSLKEDSNKTVFLGAMFAGLIVGFLSYYTGTQVSPIESYGSYDELVPLLTLTLCIALFKALMYIQHFTSKKENEKISYSRLFKLSWRNFLTLGSALLFMLCFWGVLLLWGALFRAIDIKFFQDLFEEPYFYYPILALANGIGIVIFRQQSNIIDTLTRIQQALMKYLLVVLLFVSILFLFTLLFTGLEPLWSSGGSMLILWMQAILLFFVNAVYQDDPNQRPYPQSIHRFIYIGLALLPIYSIISAYGLFIRVEQYGWSVSRCWAFLLWGLLALFSFGYSASIITKRDNWLFQLNWINIRMGFVVLLMMVLVNSPLLDFRKISANSQIQRFESGLVTWDKIDYGYLARDLAKPGYDALQQFKIEHSENVNLVLKVDAITSMNTEVTQVTQAELIATIQVLEGELPESLKKPIYDVLTQNAWQLSATNATYLQPVDLNQDTQMEYVLITEWGNNNIRFRLFYFEDNEWQDTSFNSNSTLHKRNLVEAVKSRKIVVKPPKWNTLLIDGIELHVQ